MASLFSAAARELESKVSDLLTAAGWTQRRFSCASSGSFYMGKTGNNTGEHIGVWSDWYHQSSLKSWPITTPAEEIVAGILETVANAVYPTIHFLTNSGGEQNVPAIPQKVLAQVPFEDGPGDLYVYLVDLNARYYVLGNLEVNYKSSAWDNLLLPLEYDVHKACESVVQQMRSTAAPGVIVFPVDTVSMPDRCVISAALPIRDDTTKIVKERLANTFRGFEDYRKVIALVA